MAAGQSAFSLPEGSVTWKIDFAAGRLKGKISGKEAALQSAAVYLSIPRYRYLIYSEDFGSELFQLMGKDEAYVKAAAPGLLWEALQQDDRMVGVQKVSFSQKGDSYSLSFTLSTFDGTVEAAV